MAFNIRMGLPEMEALWNDISTRKQQGKLDRDEEKFFKKLVKALGYLSENPRHNSLASHEIDDLTRKYGFKIFQSYLENNTPSAGQPCGHLPNHRWQPDGIRFDYASLSARKIPEKMEPRMIDEQNHHHVLPARF